MSYRKQYIYEFLNELQCSNGSKGAKIVVIDSDHLIVSSNGKQYRFATDYVEVELYTYDLDGNPIRPVFVLDMSDKIPQRITPIMSLEEKLCLMAFRVIRNYNQSIKRLTDHYLVVQKSLI